MPRIAPGTLLARKAPVSTEKPAACPTAGPRIQAEIAAPRNPVPRGSARAAQDALKYLNASPAAMAHGMLPGKAKRVPVPVMFRRRLVRKATPAAHHGPRATPARTFTVCWKG